MSQLPPQPGFVYVPRATGFGFGSQTPPLNERLAGASKKSRSHSKSKNKPKSKAKSKSRSRSRSRSSSSAKKVGKGKKKTAPAKKKRVALAEKKRVVHKKKKVPSMTFSQLKAAIQAKQKGDRTFVQKLIAKHGDIAID
jgi:hypothetical protein